MDDDSSLSQHMLCHETLLYISLLSEGPDWPEDSVNLFLLPYFPSASPTFSQHGLIQLLVPQAFAALSLMKSFKQNLKKKIKKEGVSRIHP